MQFHLKFPVWRCQSQIREDNRKGRNGDLLRKRTDLGFLTDTPEVLYEAQASAAIAIDTSRDSNWVVWSLIDDCFEPEDADNKASLWYYAKSTFPVRPDTDTGAASINTPLDPLTGSMRCDSLVPSDPRSYFLLVMKERMKYIQKEWLNTVDKLVGTAGEYVSNSSTFTSVLSPKFTLSTLQLGILRLYYTLYLEFYFSLEAR